MPARGRAEPRGGGSRPQFGRRARGVGGAPPAASAAAPPATPFRAHQYFDDTTGPPPAGLIRGAPARPLLHAKRSVAPSSSASNATPVGSSAPPDPEVLGFAQSGEVASGAWSSDLRFNLLSTVAYFGVNVNSNGTLITGDTGYGTWWSSQETSLINAAHAARDRVVLTVKAFNDSLIAAVTGSEHDPSDPDPGHHQRGRQPAGGRGQHRLRGRQLRPGLQLHHLRRRTPERAQRACVPVTHT